MARSPRNLNAQTAVATPVPNPSAPKTRTRSRPSALASTPTPATPSPSTAPPTPSPLGLADNVASSSKIPRQSVEAKTHGLRSVIGERERAPCPFPGEYGGRENCGVSEEDEKDEVLMALAAACAKMDNRAISSEEAAYIGIDEGWLRPPSAAIAPSTVINNAIRSHQKRCSSATPPRPCIFHKYQLSGSVNESVLEAALHPTAFSASARPKGPVWFLAPIGKVKWKNPFKGIDVPKVPLRKPGAPKRLKEVKPKSSTSQSKDSKGKLKPLAIAPVKIRLVVGSQTAVEEEDLASEAGSSSVGSRDLSRRGSTVQPDEAATAPIAIKPMPTARRVKSYADTSDESDTSDSDGEVTAGPARVMARPIKMRKERPSPLPLGTAASRSSFSHHLSRSLGSPFLDWSASGVPSSPTLSVGILPPAVSSPFPSHSLDNTTWTVRNEVDRFAAFETSSSSSDDEMRDSVDWGTASSVLIRSADETEEFKPVWSVEDEEAKIREATDALRVLFPLSSEVEDAESDDQMHFNRLDNRPTPSDTSSITESASTTTVIRGGPLKTAELACLTAWNGNSSPVASPNLKYHASPLPDASPTQHLSKLASHSFDAEEMEIDDNPWLDEAGELPVKAEDTFSDVELDDAVSVVDMPTPEHDRQLNTAAWAREAAASSSFRVKEETADYPSPLTTESDDVSAAEYRASRAGSSESHTPSSGLSELPPYELEADRVVDKPDVEEILVGPESISMEELDGWFPGMSRPDKTPQRSRLKGKMQKDRVDSSRCSGSWGGIGVGILGEPPDVNSSPISQTSKSSKVEVRRRSSTRTPQVTRIVHTLPTPPEEIEMIVPACQIDSCDMDLDAIGPDDLEAACAEAKKREEKHRKACQEQAAKQKALFDAYREKVREGQLTGRSPHDISPPAGWDRTSPWFESHAAPWGSAESQRTPSALSPMALHMSALSLDTPMYGQMDPMGMISPPLLPSAVGMMGEVMSQVEVDTAMAASQRPTGPTGPVRPAHVPSTKSQGLPPPVTQVPLIAPRPPAVTVTPVPVTTSKPVPIAPSPNSASGLLVKNASPSPSASAVKSKSPVELKPPALAPKAASPTLAPTPQVGRTPSPIRPNPVAAGTSAPAVLAAPVAAPAGPPASRGQANVPSSSSQIKSKPAPIQAGQPIAETGKPKAIRAPAEITPKPAPSIETHIPLPTGAPPAKPQGAITKPLCDGIDACVVDNIPVYAHVTEIRGLKYTLLRRLDTDFVNGTTLLSVLNVPAPKQAELLFEASPWFKAHTGVPTHCASNGGVHSAGVPGIWVPFAEARALAKKFNMPSDNLMSNILREDLFYLFAVLACINTEHAPGEAFGLPFVYKPHPQSSSQNNSSANSSSSSLTASSANSKSAPNLPALSAQSTGPQGRTAAAHLKGPLVRSAPPTPPDGCPQPKRRRATMSLAGDIAPLAKITPVAGGVGPANGKKPPPRATRASIAGDTPKPRFVKS